MTQYAYPTSPDIGTSAWTPTPCYAEIDEGTTPDDGDFVTSPKNPDVEGFEVTLQTLTDPTVHTGHIIRVRAYSSNVVTGMTVRLKEGANVRASFSPTLTTGFTEHSYTLSEGEAGAITDYSVLSLEVVSTAVANTYHYVSWGSFECPDAIQDKSLVCDNGDFDVTGQSVLLKMARKLIALTTVFVLTGSAVTLKANYKISADTDSYAVIGQDVTLDKGYVGGDILDESFEGTGYENGEDGVGHWAETLGSGSVIDEDNTDVVRPTGGGGQVLKIQKVSPNFNARTDFDKGSDQAVTYNTFFVRIAAEGLENLNRLYLYAGINDAWQLPFAINLHQVSDNLYFELRLRNDGVDNWYDSDNIVSPDTWYRIDVKYDYTGETWEWRVNEVVQDSGTLTGVFRTGPRYFEVGDASYSYTLTAYFDLVNVDSSGYVSFGQEYSIEADAGSFTETGQIASLLKDSKLDIGTDSFIETGQSVTLKHDRILSVDADNFIETGQIANLEYNRLIQIGTDSYVLTGSDVTLTYTSGYKLTADSGSYVETGQVVDLLKDSEIDIEPDSYSLSGQTIGVLHDRLVGIGTDSFDFTPYNVTLFYGTLGYEITADSGTYTLTGQSIGLLHDKRALISVGDYTETGQVVGLFKDNLIAIEIGNYDESGQTVILLKISKIDADGDSFVLTGQIVGLEYDRKLPAGLGEYVLTGSDVTLIYQVGYELLAESGSFVWNGQPIGIFHDKRISSDSDNYVVTGQTAGLLNGKILPADSGEFALYGQDVSLIYMSPLNAESGEFTVTGMPVNLIKPTFYRKPHQTFFRHNIIP